MKKVFIPGSDKPSKKGQAAIEYEQVKSILTRASGFMDAYDFSLNPYAGCSFGCTYCYAAFFSRSKIKMDTWGHWVGVKENALELLQRLRTKPLSDKTIYMSSVTDPYQPVEADTGLTRAILEELLGYHEVRLIIQTRSPLVLRDMDLLKKFKVLQVNMTVTTDDERVRKRFEPYCPANTLRLEAVRELVKNGIAACVTLTPLLPVADPEQFAATLLNTGVQKVVVQPFHADRGKFVAGTRQEALKLLQELNWNADTYQQVLEVLQRFIPDIQIGKEGFKPI